jgi:hypothetical protein
MSRRNGAHALQYIQAKGRPDDGRAPSVLLTGWARYEDACSELIAKIVQTKSPGVSTGAFLFQRQTD